MYVSQKPDLSLINSPKSNNLCSANLISSLTPKVQRGSNLPDLLTFIITECRINGEKICCSIG